MKDIDKSFMHDLQVNFDENSEGLVIEKAQTIPEEYIQSLKNQRFESKHRLAGDYHRAASIPVAIHEKWLKEGFDCTKEPIKKTLAKLRAENLDYFITTDKVL